ncbi:MAG: transcription-repair coupling factor [Paludibacteraceae bacterium]|nr:transcription-repair coupling factor [Paludibacteraceae bacterium]
MTIEELRQRLIDGHKEIDVIVGQLHQRNAGHLLLTGLHAGMRAVVLSALREQDDKHPVYLIVCDNADEAQYLYADLRTLGGGTAEAAPGTSPHLLFFPHSRRRRQSTIDESMAIQRTQTLNALAQEAKQLSVITYPEALSELSSAPDVLKQNSMTLHTGDEISIAALTQRLLNLGFQRVDFVYEPGQFAIRGGIVDIYSFVSDDPYRLDFFGDEIDSIRTFDIETQLSDKRVNEIAIVRMQEGAEQVSLAAYLPEQTIFIGNNIHLKPLQETLINDDAKPWEQTIEIGSKSSYDTYTRIAFDTLPQPLFHKQFELLMQDMTEKLACGYTIYILSDHKKQTDRLSAIMTAIPTDSDERLSDIMDAKSELFTPVDHTLHSGWIDHGRKIVCYTDHQIFERYHRVTLTSDNARRGKALMTLKEINQLQVGDYVVHSDHGIGKFGGLVITGVNGKPQEMVKLIYRNGDTIFVSIHNLHRISKYKGKEGTAPTVSRVGSGAWERLKERTKDKVKEIARDLIRLYAARKQQQGFAYTPDGYMQHELEASFIYEDTPDQAKATLDVKHDLESPQPMDRLICGDVGFGKTEIAMRAAFKVATDGKQVAVLVPTTVLALQHYTTFKERFQNFPVKVEYLSRAKTPKEVKEILDQLAEGKIDILIGTHKLIGKSVKWHDLGLLIIDEEQKFGVAVKERLKSLRTNIDVLTLTATPIPRTLQFSLLGARDLSVMTTPPPNRYPVITENITPDDEDIIKEAIDNELARNGQVFVVCNRIEMLERIEHRIHRLCPDARIVIAHGQMPADEVAQRLEDFINYDYDILISTTIIESGIDIPNVNTMFIFSAQHYGLADLHQLRGRVGRSNRKAYCYLITPERELLTADARRRIDAITTFAELGSGFHLAMQDLDIRGAGNMLGAEQSGFIADLGYETYQRILNEAVEELKEEEGLIKKEADETNGHEPMANVHQWISDAQFECDLQVNFPPEYIENISERITLYRELDTLRNEQELTAYEKRLIDRFGPLPEQARALLDVMRLRWICCRLGIDKIMLKGERMALYLPQDNNAYYQSEAFAKLIQYALNKPDRCQFHDEPIRTKGLTAEEIKSVPHKRYITISSVKTIGGAIHLLTKIEQG